MDTQANTEFDWNNSYLVKFSITYKVDFGQSLAVTGDIPELGQWGTNMNSIVRLTWTHGDVWKLTEPRKLKNHKFSYKYIVVRDNEIERWESCENREIYLDNMLNIFA